MKLISYKFRKNKPRTGALVNDFVIDLNNAYEGFLVTEKEIARDDAKKKANITIPPVMFDLISSGEEVIDVVDKTIGYVKKRMDDDGQLFSKKGDRLNYRKSEVEVLSPIPNIRTVYNIGVNYENYADMLGVIPPEPGKTCMFMVPPTSVIGPEKPVEYPVSSSEVMGEVEVGVVIGEEAKRVSESEAEEVIFGYTIVNDLVGKDIITDGLGTGREGFPGAYYIARAKGFDTFQPMGPSIVPVSEFENKETIKAEFRVNGEVKAKGDTSHYRVPINALIEYLSEDITLYPGDVISTGAIGSPEYGATGEVKPGDVMEAEIEGIGILRNPVRGPKGRE